MVANRRSHPRVLSGDQRLEALRRRIIRKMSTTTTLQVWHPADVALLRELSSRERDEFARSCKANVVSRAGGEEFEFTLSVRY